MEWQFSLSENYSWEAVALIQVNSGSAGGGQRTDLRVFGAELAECSGG